MSAKICMAEMFLVLFQLSFLGLNLRTAVIFMYNTVPKKIKEQILQFSLAFHPSLGSTDFSLLPTS